ncbi:oxidative stress-induced growth inhibitor 1-like [Maniola hyperantus]|uniref:oxidative stress-induced growth inhibitor 1-like n=1 Tax=Aphantopus hyperantus TaxID=2795564 RepID=UPI001568A9F4|nr:oxidative stress-induced growth inhibitor 1-like isoform X1 [Maniola hyperantus]XP_034825853.1 oxidative stress-induced growth inhibitor 1-like isoform X2 [Maniola hyperantus]
MRDTMKPCQHTLSDDVVYKEVVVIGNGPSGMVTSFMLAGNIPHLKPVPDHLPIDEMLKIRLQSLPPGQNLLEVDLMTLAEGLEGRSQNPIALLVDNLVRPCADLGLQEDPLIEWRYDVEKQIDHVVLGKGPPGGAWHTFPGGVRTLSPGAWLSLPPHAGVGDKTTGRVPARAVAAYCRRYVQACKLQRYFRCGVAVTSVTRAPRAPPPCHQSCPRAANFWVSGYDKSKGCGFRYACRRVIVACGAGDRPNVLPAHVSRHAVHSLDQVERALHLLATREGEGPEKSVLVVGSGVSAADAVRLARLAALPVRHVHRSPADSLAKLAPVAYPDYCHVYKMMLDGPSGNHPHYTPYPEHMIVEISPVTCEDSSPKLKQEQDETLQPKRVKLLNLVTNDTLEITVCLIAILIGSKPDLFFLQTNFSLNEIDIQKECIKCMEKKEESQRLCFLKSHWNNLKNVLEQGIQSCKSRYLNYNEINGNTDTKCRETNCNKRKMSEGNLELDNDNTSAVKCKCTNTNTKIIPYECVKKIECDCQPVNPYSSGMGFGVDPNKPVDGRSNPIAIDKSTHEILNSPKGMYALGPVTADNFIRFIPGGAVAIVAHLHKEMKNAE